MLYCLKKCKGNLHFCQKPLQLFPGKKEIEADFPKPSQTKIAWLFNHQRAFLAAQFV